MLQPELLIRALAAMSAETTLEKFCLDAGFASMTVGRSIADALFDQGIGRRTALVMSFSAADRLAVAAFALGEGCDAERVSQHLTWKDFEQLAAEVLTSLGFRTRTNVRFVKPRMELDVVAVNASGLALAVDCKHWNRSSLSSLSQHCSRQVRRTEELLRRDIKISMAVPVILTLHAPNVKLIDCMPIVPVSKFRSFALDIQGFLDEILVVRRGSASR